MRRFLEIVVIGFFLAIAMAIIFVKAGRGGGQSGGEQTATILKAGGGALAELARSLEGS